MKYVNLVVHIVEVFGIIHHAFIKRSWMREFYAFKLNNLFLIRKIYYYRWVWTVYKDDIRVWLVGLDFDVTDSESLKYYLNSRFSLYTPGASFITPPFFTFFNAV